VEGPGPPRNKSGGRLGPCGPPAPPPMGLTMRSQGRNEVKWLPGQEAIKFGAPMIETDLSEANVLYRRKYLLHY